MDEGVHFLLSLVPRIWATYQIANENLFKHISSLAQREPPFGQLADKLHAF